MIPKLIARGVDAYFRAAFSHSAAPPTIKVFSETPERPLKTFVYPSLGDKSSAPVLAMFYGGGWHHGNSWQLAAVARDLSSKGITVYLPEYRVASKDSASVADALFDAKQFYHWLLQRHKPNLIFLGGSSAGGFLAANIGLTENQKPSALILINPALNLTHKRMARVWPMLEQPNDFDVNQFLALDPMRQLRDTPPPTLILHGDRDPIIPFGKVEAYALESKRYGGRCELIAFKGYSHGFANQALFPKAHARVISSIANFISTTGNHGGK